MEKIDFRWLKFALALVTIGASQNSEGYWIPRADMPIWRFETNGALVGNRIYMVGGFSSAGAGATQVQIYTPSTDSWSVGSEMPVGLHHVNVGAAGGKLYVLGGCDHARRPLPNPNNSPWLGSSHAFEYDPVLDTWRKLKSLPHSSAAGGVAFIGGKLYLIGGVDTLGFQLSLVQEYDPVAETWRMRASMPLAREHLGIAVLDSLIYVVGGRLVGLGGSSVNTFQAYNPARNTWHELPAMPTARSGLGFAAAKGRLYAMGGEWPGEFDINEEYNPMTKAWRTVSKMPAITHGFAAIAYQDTVFALGPINPTSAFLPMQSVSIQNRSPSRISRSSKKSLPRSWLGIFKGQATDARGKIQ